MIQTEFVSLSICTISLTTGLTQVVSCCVLEIPKVLVQPMRGNQCDQIDGNFTTLVNFKGFYSGSKIFKGFYSGSKNFNLLWHIFQLLDKFSLL